MSRRVLLLLFVATWAWAPLQAAPLRAGSARVRITPPAGVPLAGYYHERGSEGVHDDLFAHALVLEIDEVQAALVSLDLIDAERFFVEPARALIEEKTGLPGGHVMISATHAHTGPILVDPALRSEEAKESLRLAADYAETLPGLIADSVIQAYAALEPAALFTGSGHEDTIAFNRRFYMKDGSVGWNPGKMNPDIVKPVGPIDPEVPFVFVRSLEGQPLATYVNYAVHLDNVGGLRISADLPATVSRCLADFLGPQAVTVYTSGACGDLNHINVRWPEPQKGHRNAARMGTILAGEILRQWPNLKPLDPGPLLVRREIVPLPIPAVTPEDVARARDLKAHNNDRTRTGFMNLVWAGQVLDVAAREGKPIEAEVQVVALGRDLAWVALPGEVFVQLGLDLKWDSPFATTIVAELSNGGIGYIPNHRAFRQGNYEVVSARCAEGSGEMLVQTARSMLRELYTLAGEN